MGIVITDELNDSFTIDLGGVSQDRKKARIKKASIRSLVSDTNGATVEVIFNNGEIQCFPYTVVDEIAGDSDITTQDKLYNAMESLIFG